MLPAILRRFAAPFAVVTLIGLVASLSARAQDAMPPLNAFAVWTSEAAVARSAPKKLVMASALNGTFFVETTEGPVDSGRIVCPAMMQVDMETGRQNGNGYCTFTAYDGAQAFGEWECTGVHLVGCQGTFKLTGGTDRLANLTGTSTLIIRGRFHEIELQGGKAAAYTVGGIAMWRDLKLESR